MPTGIDISFLRGVAKVSISGIPMGGLSMRIGRILACAVMFCLLAIAGIAIAQTDPPGIPQWAAIVHQLALKAPGAPLARHSPTGVFPPIIPQYLQSFDPSGAMETYNVAAPTDTSINAFFQSLGTNGRACATCHEPRSAWGVSTASIQQRFYASHGTDPIFRVVDGATCDSDDVSSFDAERRAYSLLLSKGLIRIFLPLPATQLGSNPPIARDFEITSINDPYGCTDLSSNPPIVSVYRRPLLSANLRFLTQCPASDPSCAPLSIMWDGREPSLESQATDATLGHAQALNPPSDAQVAQIVAFESNIFDAQVFDFEAGRLDQDSATGGPVFLSQQNFFIGINDSLSPGFNNVVFTLFDAWQNLAGSGGEGDEDTARASIARGETLFNTKNFTISNVNGLNLEPTDPLGQTSITGTCTTCHDSPNVGNHSEKLAINIGVADASPPVLDISGLPVFTVQCTDTSGPLQGQVFTVTDLGRALITGRCADVGKVKGPILHGLAARAPYFHNGSAATLEDIVNFYDQRFSIGFTDQEKEDLVAFLKAL
jgi:cytochrome c peroxidase